MGNVFSPLQISCYWSFDRSVEFLFKDELLFEADADIIRYRVSMNTTSFRPNDCSVEAAPRAGFLVSRYMYMRSDRTCMRIVLNSL